MKIQTRHFAELEVPEDIVLTFEEGIPGFPNSKRFILIEEPEEENDRSSLFYWLQSVDEPDIALALMDVSKVMPDYDPLVEVDEISSLGNISTEAFFIYNVVVIPPDNVEKMSVNLKAPIVINDRLKKGKQVLSKNDDYPIRYYIYEELSKNR